VDLATLRRLPPGYLDEIVESLEDASGEQPDYAEVVLNEVFRQSIDERDAYPCPYLFRSRMRSMLKLLDRVGRETDARILEAQIGICLDARKCVWPDLLNDIGIGPETTYEKAREILGDHSMFSDLGADAETERLDKMLSEDADGTRKSQWIFRCVQAAHELGPAAWYPFWVTLTVDPCKVNHDVDQWWRDGKGFRKYLKRLHFVAGKSLGYTRAELRDMSVSETVVHMASLEHGESGEHDHVHAIVWLRGIPDDWKEDPNKGRLLQYRTERRCRPMESLWEYSNAGLSPVRYLRFTGDIWSTRLGFVTPIDAQGCALKIDNIEYCGRYVAKYIGKEAKRWNHRLKVSRKFGTGKLTETLETMTDLELEQISEHSPPTHAQMFRLKTRTSVPLSVVKSKAKTMLFIRRWDSGTLTLEDMTRQPFALYQAMLQSVADGQRPWRMTSSRKYRWLRRLRDQDGYCDATYRSAFEKLALAFPSDETRKYARNCMRFDRH